MQKTSSELTDPNIAMALKDQIQKSNCTTNSKINNMYHFLVLIDYGNQKLILHLVT